ncbi:MAG: PspC domain-containing protein [Acidimicrobiales bacterium]
MASPRVRRDHRGIPEPVDSLSPPEMTGPAAPEGQPSGWQRPSDDWGSDLAPWASRRWSRRWHQPRDGHLGHHRRFCRGSLRRSGTDRLFGGVAGGLARCTGIDVMLLRIGFIVAALAGGFGAAAYLVLWLILPMEAKGSIAARATKDRRGIVLSISFLPLFIVTAVLGRVFDAAYLGSFAWPLFVGAAGVVLIWRNCDDEERAWIRQVSEPVLRFGSELEHRRRRLIARCLVGILLLAGGALALVLGHPSRAVLRPLGGALLVVAGFVVLFGPWWLRLARDLVAERQARVRAEDRADMAARVHDSVLQTLAMIQRSADRPQKVVQLARTQERELRAWLFEGELPGNVGETASSLACGVQMIATEVEPAYGVPVDVVTVGDCPLDDRLRALLGAAREATVNAAKWSGAPTVQLFAEAERERASIFVRDRGRGFDADAVAEDRRGIAESIQARVLRQGGRAVIRSAPGEGTEIELTMPLVKARR